MEHNYQNPVTDNVGAGVDSKSQTRRVLKSIFLIIFTVCGLVVIAFAIKLVLVMMNLI